ncbi:hypothetical protein Tco_0959212 [Tanacetum coccineum]
MHLIFKFKEDYTIVHKPRAIIYRDRNNQKKMIRETEVHKFSDDMLMRILEKLDHMVKDYVLFKFNPGMKHKIWSEDDKRRSKEFIKVIERRLKIRRIFKSLESLVSGRKVDKNRVFNVNLKHNGIFSPYPISYINGDEKQLTDFDFEDMSYDNLRELVRKLVHSPVPNLYYCKVGKTLKQGLCKLNNDDDLQKFMRVGYESKLVVDLYSEHYGYDVMDFRISQGIGYESGDSSDAYYSSDEEDIDYVYFFHEGEHNVVIKNITTNDPSLTKLCSNNGPFRGFMNELITTNEELHMEDPEPSTLEPTHKVQGGKKPNKKIVKMKGKLSFKVNKVKTRSSQPKLDEETSKDGEGSSRNRETLMDSTKDVNVDADERALRDAEGEKSFSYQKCEENKVSLDRYFELLPPHKRASSKGDKLIIRKYISARAWCSD